MLCKLQFYNAVRIILGRPFVGIRWLIVLCWWLSGTSPHVVANTLKRFLLTLPEPLLTYKCVRQICYLDSSPHLLLHISELTHKNLCMCIISTRGSCHWECHHYGERLP
jgi:hypothetical protein